MAQEVRIAGATYPDVPSIRVPNSSSVYHSFYDVSNSTLTQASDLMEGVTAYDNTGTLLTGTGTGSGGTDGDNLGYGYAMVGSAQVGSAIVA